MRPAACVWLLCVALLNLQGCAENQVAPSHAHGNTPLAQRTSTFPHPTFQGHPVVKDDFPLPLDETDVTDEDMYENYHVYDYPEFLTGEENIDNLVSQIQEEMAWSNGHPAHLARIRHAIAKVREAVERRAALKSHATAARNEMEKKVSEEGRAEEAEDLASKIRQSLEKSEELLKKASVGEQHHDYDVREPSAAIGNRREGSETSDDVQHASDGVIVAPHLWQKTIKRNHQGAIMAGLAKESQDDTARANDEIAEAKLMLHLLENPIWAEWSGWSRCQGQCGTGYRTRTRACRVQGLCEDQTVAETCPLKDECENPRGYVAGTVAVSVLAVLLVTMLAAFLLLPKIQKYRISRWESEREAFIQANLKKRGSMPDRPPPAAPRPASTLPAKLPSGEHVYLTLSEVKVDGKTYLAQAGKSAEDCVYLTPSQINQPKTDMYQNPEDDPENEEEVNMDEENAYLELQGAN